MKYLNDQQSQQLRLADTADLRPNSNEVLIATQASGINRADLLQLDGHYPPPVGASDIIGLEVAGQVLSAPPGCNFQVGDKVMALLSGGGYAEQVCVDVGSVMPMPANLSYVQAAAIPEAFITAYQALFTLGRLHEKIAQNGEPPVRVLIHAGASGVGTAAIQLANLSGAQVFTTASSAQKLAAAKALGATHLINYHQTSFSQYIKQATGGAGVDIIVDFIGGDYLSKNINAAASDAVLVNLAMLGGRYGDTFDFAKVLAKRLTLVGSTLRNRSDRYKSDLIGQFSHQFLDYFATGQLHPVIDSQYTYKQVACAYQKIRDNLTIGKLVLHSFDQ